MSADDMKRFVQDMQQPALRDTLGAQLKQSGSAEAAAAMLQGAGYNISAEELKEASAELSDRTLDQFAGGADGWVIGDWTQWWQEHHF
ncbi:Nif11-like leader peptide family RiPP precursor [Pseudoroseomonas cervicalis]|uniref:Nif11-like leader peptide family RiPP precursor n=1 Tax=Teichococcus cervicalis TaxID=204525 RepID=UPI0022F1C9C1|nr:Nif11-like leader peptide family RiPP precursor [Pseudoroseomonas cervicalis]WBV41628.1 Nif11-like leader peptide family RiPP precursor [Pseudoroseomonas cervicalis]